MNSFMNDKTADRTWKKIKLTSIAINSNFNDYNLYCRRSSLYELLGLYRLSLEDAKKAILIDDVKHEAFVNQAKAYIGLKLFIEAEKSLNECLIRNGNSEYISNELINIRFLAIKQIGFDDKFSGIASKKFLSVTEAIDGALSMDIEDAEEAKNLPVDLLQITNRQFESQNQQQQKYIYSQNYIENPPSTIVSNNIVTNIIKIQTPKKSKNKKKSICLDVINDTSEKQDIHLKSNLVQSKIIQTPYYSNSYIDNSQVFGGNQMEVVSQNNHQVNSTSYNENSKDFCEESSNKNLILQNNEQISNMENIEQSSEFFDNNQLNSNENGTDYVDHYFSDIHKSDESDHQKNLQLTPIKDLISGLENDFFYQSNDFTSSPFTRGSNSSFSYFESLSTPQFSRKDVEKSSSAVKRPRVIKDLMKDLTDNSENSPSTINNSPFSSPQKLIQSSPLSNLFSSPKSTIYSSPKINTSSYKFVNNYISNKDIINNSNEKVAVSNVPFQKSTKVSPIKIQPVVKPISTVTQCFANKESPKITVVEFNNKEQLTNKTSEVDAAINAVLNDACSLKNNIQTIETIQIPDENLQNIHLIVNSSCNDRNSKTIRINKNHEILNSPQTIFKEFQGNLSQLPKNFKVLKLLKSDRHDPNKFQNLTKHKKMISDKMLTEANLSKIKINESRKKKNLNLI